MKTATLLKLLLSCILLLTLTTGYGQSVETIINRKLKKRSKRKLEKTIDKGLDILEGKDGSTKSSKKRNGGDVSGNQNKTGKYIPLPNFIDRSSAFFIDDFNNERPSEFPSKWTLLSGTVQNAQVVALGKKEGVVQFISSSRLKPTFKNDRYLGNSFKIEIQCYFHRRGNEAYTLHLMNKDNPRKNYQITIRAAGIVPAGASSQYARLPETLPAGWRTIQLSFNKGVFKVHYDGYQLINIPKLNKGLDKILTEFTHLEVRALTSSREDTKAMINYVSMAKTGLPLYKKLMNEGRIVSYDILFKVNSYKILPSSFASIDNMIAMLLEHPKLAISIEGHTDSDGSNTFNQTLSENRARAVQKYMIGKGIDKNRLTAIGFGEERPVDRQNTLSAKAQNRRVEFVLKK